MDYKTHTILRSLMQQHAFLFYNRKSTLPIKTKALA